MRKKEEEKVKATLDKEKVNEGLNADQKALLEKFIGNSSSNIDMNKVRDEWKHGKDRF